MSDSTTSKSVTVAIPGGMLLDANVSRIAGADPLRDAEVMVFFESEIRPKLTRDHFVHAHDVFSHQLYKVGTALAHQEVLAAWNSERLVAATEVTRKNLVRSLQTAVEAFQQTVARAPVEMRLRQLEDQLTAIRKGLLSGGVTSGGQRVFAGTLEDLKPHVKIIREAAEKAFDYAHITVSLQPSANSDHPVNVTLDLSSGDSSSLAKLRAAGARRSFYELVLKQLPGELFDAVEFDFKFPDE